MVLLLDDRDLGERARDADEARDVDAEPGALRKSHTNSATANSTYASTFVGHPHPVHFRAQVDEQRKHSADHTNSKREEENGYAAVAAGMDSATANSTHISALRSMNIASTL
jgi:hypothetical protein